MGNFKLIDGATLIYVDEQMSLNKFAPIRFPYQNNAEYKSIDV